MVLAVDTSIWVSACVPSERVHAAAHNFAVDVFAGAHQVVAPVTSITEVICAIARRSVQAGLDDRLSVAWGERIAASPFVSLKQIDRSFAREASFCGRIHRLRGMDALVAATALYYNVPLLCEDAEFRRLSGAMTILSLNDLLR